MNSFLANIRPRLASEPDAPVFIVSGNESADLDSIVSALTTAWFLQRYSPKSICIPFINTERADLPLRNDTVYVFEQTKVDPSLLFFRDELDTTLKKIPADRMSLFLVDHNLLSGSLSQWNNVAVSGVIDHHDDEGLYTTANPRRIEVTGSCTSLIAETFMKELQTKVDSEDCKSIARLMMGPILVDTGNLNPAINKAKPLDIAMHDSLLPLTGWSNTDFYYKAISDARHDTSKLSCYDLLRKDYKEWTVTRPSGDSVKVGISSVPGLVQKYIARDSKQAIRDAIQRWSNNRSLDLYIALWQDDLGAANGGYQREFLMEPYTTGFDSLREALEASDMKLERLTDLDTDDFVASGGRVYRQHNTTWSRKLIWPLVEKLLVEGK
ncbi:Exopolyphosphatase [Actinomortierella ambigua]|nr:Exopolyphosphatase [Actinomortierella ambigua]